MGGYTTQNPTPSGDITGSGTENYIAIFTGANTIGNSTMYFSTNAYVPAVKDFNIASPISAIAPNMSAGQQISYSFYGGTDTTQTASQEINRYLFSSGNRQWATGAISIQREFYITSPIYSFVAASTITNAYTLYVNAPTASTNATITNNWGLGVSGSATISGILNVGNYASPTNLRVLTIGQDTAYGSFGSRVGGTGNFALYNVASPDSSNWSFSSDGSTLTALNNPSLVSIRVTNNDRIAVNNSFFVFSPGSIGTGAITPFTFTVPANTGQTASTEIPNFKVTGNTKTWAAGTITTQRWNYLTANTAAFASASTIAESIGLDVEAAVAGSNATITNNFAARFTAGTATLKFGNVTGSTTSWAIYANQSTPSAANYILAGTNADTELNSGTSAGRIFCRIGGNTVLTLSTSTFTATGGIAQSSGAITNFTFNVPSNTGQTASTEISGYLYNSYTRTWAAGAITTQRERYIKTVTYAFASASTITSAYACYIEAPTAGSNATITNNFALGLSGNINLATAGNGIYIKEGTNATMGSVSVVLDGALPTDTVVSTTKVTANSRIILTVNSSSNTAVNQITTHIYGRSAGTSFTIRTMTGDAATTVTVSWLILEPAP